MKKRMLSALLALCMMLTMAPTVAFAAEGDDVPLQEEATSSTPPEKTLYVDRTYDNASDTTFKTIQGAINQINSQDDKTGWTIEVTESGEYDRFVVLSGMDNLTVKAAEGVEATINTLNGTAPEDVTFNSGNWMDLGGIQLWDADNVTIEGFKIRVVDNATYKPHHMSAAISNHNEAGVYADSFTIRNCDFVGTGNMSGQGNGNVAISISKFSSFTVEDCTFTDFMEAIRGQSDGADVKTVSINNNTFTDCSFAIHEYAGDSDETAQGTYSFTNNTVKGTADLYSKAYFEDLYVDNQGQESNGYTIDISGNTFENAIAGLVNLEDNGGTTDDVLNENIMNKNSFVVTGKQASGQIEMHATYEAPEGSSGYWLWTGKENAEGGGNPADAAEKIQAAIDKANAEGSTTLKFGVDDPDDFLLTFTWFKDMIYWVTESDPVDPGDPVNPEEDVTIDKTATDLDSHDRTDVTLRIGAGQGQTVSDVVFVLDKSVSVDVRESAAKMLRELMERAGENRIKVGVVVFNKSIYEQLPLTDLSSETYDEIYNALMATTSSGTNIQAGLLAGKAMLDADTSVAKEAKHLVLVTDGVTYLWGTGTKEDGSDIYSIYSESVANGEENLYASHETISWHHPDTGRYFHEFQNVAQWYSRYSDQVQQSINNYQHIYASGQYKANKYGVASGQGKDTDWSAVPGFEGNTGYIPYENWQETACATDAAIYSAVTTWKAILEAGYHPYAYAEQDYATTYPWAPDWIESLNTVGGTSGAVPENTDGMFDDVKSSIVYAIQSGEVTDVIGDDFNLTIDPNTYEINPDTHAITLDTFTLTVNGEPVKAAEVDTASNTVFFGEQVDGKYPYEVTYYPNGTEQDTREQFVWKINVPVESAKAVSLTYKLDLVNKESTSGTHIVPTNEEAVLDYTSTTGDTGEKTFPVPDVKYTVGAITITPVDVTLYIGGTSSYWEDIDGTQTPSANSGIPAPHFYISGADDEEIANMTFHGTGKNEAGEIVNKVWKVEPYGDEGAQAVGENGQKVWNIVSADENAADASCLYFSDIECTDSVDADNIANNQYTHLYATISTTNESGAGNTNLYAMVGGQRYELGYGVGDMTIRSVTNDATSGQEYIFGVAHSTESDIYAVQNDTVAAADATQNGTEAGVVAPAGTSYTVNGKENWELVGENTSLLFDDVLSTYELGESGEHDASEAGETMLEQAVIDNAEELGLTDMSGRQYESKYFDLVDAADGNVWVKADNQIVVYWPYPEGITSSNADEYDFDLFHFTGMHREYERGQDEAQELVNQAAANINNHGDYDISNDTVALMVEDIELTDHGIQFIVDQDAFGFSPFVLTWVAKDDSDGGNHSSGGGDNKPDDLNTEDHFAYIIGYPKDYRTGEPTDDESLWPVEPQGDITRAEVATIFFRMLTDDARNENWSQTNSFTDVASTEWYNNAISTLANMGIISGDPDGSFRPDDSITRAEFTKIAVGFFDKAGDYVDGTYEDVSASDWYADFIDAAVDLGLIEGYPDGTIRPNASITRAEACTIVNRTLGRVPDKDHLLAEDEMRVWPDNSDTDAWYYAQIQEATNSHDYNWITEDGEEIEEWTDKLADRDWAQLEREWSDANSAPGGEVVD